MGKIQILIKSVIPLILIVTITIGLSAFIYRQIMLSEQSLCWQTLQDTADTISESIELQMNDNINTLRLASNAMVQENRVESHDAIIRHIDAFQDMTIFSRIDMMYPDGTALFQNGETGNVSEEISFAEIILSAEQGVYLSSRVEDILTGEPVVRCYVPVMNGDSASAIMVGIIKCSELPGYFGSQAYGGEAVSCIVSTVDGNFIMDDWHDTLGNFYEMKDRQTLPEYKDVDLKKEIRENNTGVTAYVSEQNGEPSYMHYSPTGIKGWQLLVVAQEDVIFSGAEKLKQLLMIFGVVETVLIFIYLLWGSYNTYQLLSNKAVLEKQLRISNTLNNCTRELAMHSELDAAINGLLKIINDFFTGDRTYIFRIDKTKAIVQNTYEYAAEGITPQIQNLQNVPLEAIDSWNEMFENKGMFFISDIDRDVDGRTITYEILLQQGIHSLLAVPLYRNGEIVGFLGVDNPKANSSSPELLKSIQFFIMDALERKEHRIILEKMSITDGLTGVYNRNKFNLFFEECKNNEYERIGVAYFDLNGLKKTNDLYGHEAGDKFIISVADIISEIFPKHTFRIGGDEFAVLLPNTRKADFMEKTESIYRQLNLKNCSVSYGISYSRQSSELEIMMKEADRKMYENKRIYYETHSGDRRR